MALIQCPKCDKQISDKARKCPNCGFIPKYEEVTEISKNSINWHYLSIISLILSFLFSPIGLVAGIISLTNCKDNQNYTKEFATAAIIISSIILLTSLLYIIVSYIVFYFIVSNIY